MPDESGPARTSQVPAAGRLIPQLIGSCNSLLDLRRFGDEAADLSRYITALPHPDQANDPLVRRMRQSGLPRLIFDAVAHGLQLVGAADAGATASGAATAAQAEVASLKVLCRLIHSAWYCVLIIPAPVVPDGSAAMTELVDSGEC
jgi:hypothetical protein